MASKYILSSLLLLIIVTDVRTQFFDFFGFSPISQATRSPTKHLWNDHTTKRPKVEHTRRTDHRVEQTKKNHVDVSVTVHEIGRNNTRPKKRKQTTVAPLFDFNFFTTTTPKPTRKTTKRTSSHKTTVSTFRLSTEKSKPSHDVLDSDGIRNWYDKPIVSNIADYYTTVRPVVTTKPYSYTTTSKPANYARPNYNNVQPTVNNFERPTNNFGRPTTNNNYQQPSYNNDNYYRPTNNYDRPSTNNNRPTYNNNHNLHTTKNPFYNRPGVKPTVVDNRPPITNRPVTRPVTKRPVTTRPYVVNNRPTDTSAISFPNEDINPEVIFGIDEDHMSDAEKKRYIEMSERMCDKYKALNTKQLQAIPLIPSPDPVRVNVSTCTPPNVPLVIGGEVVSINDYPHMALLGWVKVEGGGYSWKCGGSLISDQFVLTAAHCAYQERDNTVIAGPPRVVQLGSSYLDDPGALVVKVSAVIRHPKYKQPKSYYDTAVVKLLYPVTFSEVIKPACLGVPPSPGRPVIATGWGRTEFGDDQSLELRSVSIPVWDIRECHTALGTSRKLPDGPSSDSQICAGERQGGKDTCQGDSGGPAQIQDGCVWRVVAVTSFGRLCGAPNTPGVYAKVHRAFVAGHIFGGLGNIRNRKRTPNFATTTQRNYQQELHNNYRPPDTNNNKRPNVYSDDNQRQSGYGNNNRRQTDYNNDQLHTGYSNDNQRQTGYNNDNRRPTDYNNDQPQTGYSNDNQRQISYSNDNQRQTGYSNDNQRQTGYSNDNRPTGYNNDNQPQNGYSNDSQRQNSNSNSEPNNNYYVTTENSHVTNYNRPQTNQRHFNNGRNWWI